MRAQNKLDVEVRRKSTAEGEFVRLARIAREKAAKVTADDRRRHDVGAAYGNVKMSNSRLARATVEAAPVATDE